MGRAPTFSPGTVISHRNRLWRVDGQDGDVLTATAIDTGEAIPKRFYVPFEKIEDGELPPPDPDQEAVYDPPFRVSPNNESVFPDSANKSRNEPRDQQCAQCLRVDIGL